MTRPFQSSKGVVNSFEYLLPMGRPPGYFRRSKAFRRHEDQVEFVYLVGLPMSDLLREAAHLPEGSIVYYLHVFEDGLGEASIPAEVVDTLSKAANAPVYGHYRTYLGRGIVGGR